MALNALTICEMLGVHSAVILSTKRDLATEGLQIRAVTMTNALLELVGGIVDTYLTQAGGYSVLDSGVGWRLRRRYAAGVAWLVAIVLFIDFVIGLLMRQSLSTFLFGLLIPTLPALQQGVETLLA